MAEKFNSRKMRWLNSIMYCKELTTTDRCVAYYLADRLNSGTGDCWPSQPTIARQLGVSVKTVQRSVRKLERLGFLRILRSRRKGETHRYRPNFLPASGPDNHDPTRRHPGPRGPDTNVSLFYLTNLSRTYSADSRERKQVAGKARDRGLYEVRLAKRFGPDGFTILAQLHSRHDGIVADMCDKERDGTLTDADLMAARLAARQVRP